MNTEEKLSNDVDWLLDRCNALMRQNDELRAKLVLAESSRDFLKGAVRLAIARLGLRNVYELWARKGAGK